jgi:hypothetical protein
MFMMAGRRVQPKPIDELQHLKAGIEPYSNLQMDVCLGSLRDRGPHVFIKAVSATKK